MSVDAVVNRLGVSCGKIIKSILFVDDAGQPVLGIVTRDKRVSERKLAMACGAKNVRRANPYFFIWWAKIGVALITKALAFGLLAFYYSP